MAGIAGKICAFATLVVMALGTAACAAQAGSPPVEHWTWGTVSDGDMAPEYDQIRFAFARNDFATLDAMEATYRDSDRQTPSGASKLEAYYQILTGMLAKYDPLRQCNDGWQPFLDKWRAASPHSAAAIIANATMIDDRAWCYRGGDNAGAVSADAWQPFNDNVAAASTLLEKNKAVASADPEYYAERESLAVAQGMPRADFKRLTDEATARFPDYPNIYYAAYQFYQPQWYGSNADVDALARYMIGKTRAREGTGNYFRFYWHAAQCNCREHLAAADLSTMRTAMADLAQRYPVDHSFIHLAQMACMLGDADDAKIYFAKITINDARYWREADWDECRAMVGPSAQPFPQTPS